MASGEDGGLNRPTHLPTCAHPIPSAALVSVTGLWNVKSSMGFRQTVLGKAWPCIQTVAHTLGHLEQDGHMTGALGLVTLTRVEG